MKLNKKYETDSNKLCYQFIARKTWTHFSSQILKEVEKI